MQTHHTRHSGIKKLCVIFLGATLFSAAALTGVAPTKTALAHETQQTQNTQDTQETQQSQPEPAAPFSDVEAGNAHFVAIKYLKDNGLIDGYEDSTFKPLQEVNRAEAVKMLMKAIQGPKTTNPEPFSFADVKSDDWFYPYLTQAWDNFLVSGYPDGLFHPEKTINVAESLKIVLKQEGQIIPQTASYQPYSDVPVDAWYAPYAQIAKERTLFLESRSDGSLQADTNVNRAVFAELLYRMLKSSEGSKFARATWYADFLAQTKTASGEPYAPDAFTAAHKTLPFGTKLRVLNLANGKSVDVIVNDRGPYATGVDLDLSRSAFEAIASSGTGIINVEFMEIEDEEAADPNAIEYGF